ncbi:MAG: aldolase/citrate lyase family protein [Beijerinckiaceae bacterium]|nr:aldolase/citrate lyase family protein [Beijerinckiaceae bacterium]MCZ8300780.1 aldolase/citrate lyase family protein [Beijerinckiaceae bacterium]
MSANPILSFARRLHAGPASFCAWSGMRDPAIIEALLREGFDCAVLDWQHGFHDFSSIQAGILAAHAHGAAAMVRIGVGQFAEAARFLDWGAAGIIAPMINSPADARAFVEYVKYPPKGARSWGPARAANLTRTAPIEHLHGANGFTLAIAMIETKEALAALDDILAVEGIDGVLVGPSDLSITLTGGETVDAAHPLVDEALTRVAASARARGKLACAFCMDGTRAAELAQRGYHLLSIGQDQILLRLAGRQELAKAKLGLPAAEKGAGY